MLDHEVKNWYRDNYLASTEPSLLQFDEIDAAFSSDLLWWAEGLGRDLTKKAMRNSLCFGLYILPRSTAEMAGRGSPKQVGLLRVVTDDVTFAYLTDIYVLPEHQGKGLGAWMMQCLKEVMTDWKHLRRLVFFTTDTMDFYRQTLGAKDWSECESAAGLLLGMVDGPAAPLHRPRQ